ncbi:hypothetical protein OGZ37_13015, partial [Lactococcus lactis]|uniref:hypothetical protein n=1 Tax=Lactococcus lactis TaxID=1358 RepID=UPI002418197C
LLYSIKPTSPCQELTVTFIPFFILRSENPVVVMFSNVQFFIENVILGLLFYPLDIVRENLQIF